MIYTLARDLLGLLRQPEPPAVVAPFTECGALERLLERSLEKRADSCPTCPELRCTFTVNILLAFSFSCSLLSFIAGAVLGRRRLTKVITTQTGPEGPGQEREDVRVVPSVAEAGVEVARARGPVRPSQLRLQNR